MRFAVFVAAAVLFGAAPAFADCASPNTFLVPESGELSANAVLYVFASSWARPLKSVDVIQLKRDLANEHVMESVDLGVTPIGVYGENGQFLDARVSAEPSSDAFQVFRVEVSAGKASALVVRFGDREYPFTIGKGSSAAKEPVRITGNTSTSYAWTCSHHSTRDLPRRQRDARERAGAPRPSLRSRRPRTVDSENFVRRSLAFAMSRPRAER